MISLTIIVWTKFRLLYCYMNVHTCPRLSGPYEKKTISIIQSWNWPDVPQFDCLVLAVAYKVSPVPLWVEECDSVNVAWTLNISKHNFVNMACLQKREGNQTCDFHEYAKNMECWPISVMSVWYYIIYPYLPGLQRAWDYLPSEPAGPTPEVW